MTLKSTPRILIIAGSDSSGGAGIEADIKTVTLFGGYAMTAITALTAQNTQGVFGVHPTPPEFVAQQIRLVTSDIGVDAIKSGMLFDANMIAAVATEIATLKVPYVLDPVMVSTSGSPLLKSDAIDALIHRLFPLATLITPNIPEAELLCGATIKTPQDMLQAAKAIIELSHRRMPVSGTSRPRHKDGVADREISSPAILLKGGHLEGETVHDLLWQDGQAIWFHSPKLISRHTHGTGCTLASVIATGLGRGEPLEQAIQTARNYVIEAIRTAPGFGKGSGPLNHMHGLG